MYTYILYIHIKQIKYIYIYMYMHIEQQGGQLLVYMCMYICTCCLQCPRGERCVRQVLGLEGCRLNRCMGLCISVCIYVYIYEFIR